MTELFGNIPFGRFLCNWRHFYSVCHSSFKFRWSSQEKLWALHWFSWLSHLSSPELRWSVLQGITEWRKNRIPTTHFPEMGHCPLAVFYMLASSIGSPGINETYWFSEFIQKSGPTISHAQINLWQYCMWMRIFDFLKFFSQRKEPKRCRWKPESSIFFLPKLRDWVLWWSWEDFNLKE